MLLDSPAIQLRYTLKDILGVVESVLKKRHWRNFEIESTSLIYVPHWFFSFDVYEERDGQSKTFASQMALDALTGKLNPLIVQIIESVPIKREKELAHGIKCDVLRSVIKREEVKEIGGIKIAGQMSVQKGDVTVSGVNLVYVPYWQVWVRLPSGMKRFDLDAISGSPVDVSDVPERERGNIEITMDMLNELKTPQGWVDYSKKTFNWGFGVASTAGQGFLSSVVPWVLNTRAGKYTALLFVILLLLWLLKMKG